MTEKEGKKHIIATVPAILTGTAALIAALTTTFVTLRDGKEAAPEAAATSIAAPDASAAQNPTVSTTSAPPAAQTATASSERPLLLSVERIAVHSDGTAGTTNWRFSVEVDGEPRFAFEQARMTDEGGRNIAFPKQASTALRLAQGKPAKIVVKGWKTSAFRAVAVQPDAQGEGRLDGDGKPEAIQVSALKPDMGAFTFYFSADAVQSAGASTPDETVASAK
jgi:hypothetical protein